MNWTRSIGFLALALYSIVLIRTEVVVSQEYARHFITDITGPVVFYAVNTTLSVFLQMGTALLFAVSFTSTQKGKQNRNERIFYVSQIFIFSFLGLDDRFLFHERIGAKIGINDAFVLLVAGISELFLLLTIGNLRKQKNQIKYSIYAAAVFFGLMVYIDSVLPREMVPRLSLLEDLAKTWGAAFIFLFAWQICIDRVNTSKLDFVHLHNNKE